MKRPPTFSATVVQQSGGGFTDRGFREHLNVAAGFDHLTSERRQNTELARL
jgi:hypothetical protein